MSHRHCAYSVEECIDILCTVGNDWQAGGLLQDEEAAGIIRGIRGGR